MPTPTNTPKPVAHDPYKANRDYWASAAGQESLRKYPETPNGPILYPYFNAAKGDTK